jgi:hypothetical protein
VARNAPAAAGGGYGLVLVAVPTEFRARVMPVASRVAARQRSPEATTVAACSAIVAAWPASGPARITTSEPVRRAVARDAGA